MEGTIVSVPYLEGNTPTYLCECSSFGRDSVHTLITWPLASDRVQHKNTTKLGWDSVLTYLCQPMREELSPKQRCIWVLHCKGMSVVQSPELQCVSIGKGHAEIVMANRGDKNKNYTKLHDQLCYTCITCVTFLGVLHV